MRAVEVEAGVVGFAGFGPSQETPAVAEIGTLYAMPRVWGTGIGKHLMRLARPETRNGKIASWSRTHGTNTVEHDDGPFSGPCACRRDGSAPGMLARGDLGTERLTTGDAEALRTWAERVRLLLGPDGPARSCAAWPQTPGPTPRA
ncbi:GNAT family N-acetyltransferase [Streptomyces sp. NPDC057099]|uniref:GNAT family N-acetyltransferase n=1 Tax=Streptomyces sp. NPDC057099 TaxID=3346019 RepID=UPI00363A8915